MDITVCQIAAGSASLSSFTVRLGKTAPVLSQLQPVCRDHKKILAYHQMFWPEPKIVIKLEVMLIIADIFVD